MTSSNSGQALMDVDNMAQVGKSKARRAKERKVFGLLLEAVVAKQEESHRKARARKVKASKARRVNESIIKDTIGNG